jgi:hypothetical protein
MWQPTTLFVNAPRFLNTQASMKDAKSLPALINTVHVPIIKWDKTDSSEASPNDIIPNPHRMASLSESSEHEELDWKRVKEIIAGENPIVTK